VAEASPRVRILVASERLGRETFVQRCEDLLRGTEPDVDFLLVLGGAPARRFLGDGAPEGQRYWLRVWALRGLLWAGPGDVEVLRKALADRSWRVREMAAKVVARHELDELLDDVSKLEQDSVRRVRDVARRAAVAIVGAPA
jgi:HEAT repeat protein